MKILLAIALMLASAAQQTITASFPISAGGGISFLAKGCAGGSSTTTLACSVPSSSITGVPSGATFLIWISNGGVGTVTVTDTGSFSSLAVIPGYPCTYHGSQQATVWIETGAAAGTHTFSATIPTNAGTAMNVVAATGGTVDATTGTKCATTFSTTATTNSLTTTQTNDLAFMLVGDTGGGVTYTFASSPINLTSSGFASGISDVGYGPIATISTTHGVATLSSGNQWVADLVALHF